MVLIPWHGLAVKEEVCLFQNRWLGMWEVSNQTKIMFFLRVFFSGINKKSFAFLGDNS